MDSERNKEAVLLALRHWKDKNLPAFFDLIHDEATYLLPYLPERFRYGGSHNKADTIAVLTEWRSAFERFALDIVSATAEEDRVVVEFTVAAEGPGSATYRNRVCFAVRLKDGKMHTIHEFFDPFKVLAYVEQVQSIAAVGSLSGVLQQPQVGA
jgi:ketosteroid isomerase-like protein